MNPLVCIFRLGVKPVFTVNYTHTHTHTLVNGKRSVPRVVFRSLTCLDRGN